MTDAPEVTGTASVVSTSTRNDQSTVTPQNTSAVSSPPSNSPSEGSSNDRAIAGGAVGGIGVAVLITGIVSCFTTAAAAFAATSRCVIYPPFRRPGYHHHGTPYHPLALINETPRVYVIIPSFFLPGHVKAPLIGPLRSLGPLKSEHVSDTATTSGGPYGTEANSPALNPTYSLIVRLTVADPRSERSEPPSPLVVPLVTSYLSRNNRGLSYSSEMLWYIRIWHSACVSLIYPGIFLLYCTTYTNRV